MAIVSQVDEDEPLPATHPPEPDDPLTALVNLLRNCPSLSLHNTRHLDGFLSKVNFDACNASCADGQPPRLPEEKQAEIYEVMQQAVRLLEVPFTFTLEEWDLDSTKVREMTYWRTASADVLQLLRKLLRVRHCEAPHLMAQDIFIALSRLVSLNGGDAQLDTWCTPESAALALDALSALQEQLGQDETASCVHAVMNTYLRGCFARQGHAHVNPQTGRKIHHPQGTAQHHLDRHHKIDAGDLSSAAGAKWKGGGYPPAIGCWNVYLACLRRLDANGLLESWHLVVPPLMCLMDDPDPPYRLKGIEALEVLLEKCPASMFKRTGIDQLVQKSLSVSLTYLSSPDYVPLVDAGFQTNLRLILHQHGHPSHAGPQDMSAQCFDGLSRLMKEGPLHILFFASEKPAFAIRAAEGISALVDVLGILSVRFLADILHPLIGILSFPSMSSRKESRKCVIFTCQALQSLLRVSKACEPAKRWRGALLAAAVKCWSTLRDSSVDDCEEVERALQTLVSALMRWDSRLQDETAFLRSDNEFRALFTT